MAVTLLNKHANHGAVCGMLTKVHLSHLPVPVPLPRERRGNGRETDEYQVPLLQLPAD